MFSKSYGTITHNSTPGTVEYALRCPMKGELRKFVLAMRGGQGFTWNQALTFSLRDSSAAHLTSIGLSSALTSCFELFNGSIANDANPVQSVITGEYPFVVQVDDAYGAQIPALYLVCSGGIAQDVIFDWIMLVDVVSGD